jgi:Holliday junction resolvase RusA-like endonuclease
MRTQHAKIELIVPGDPRPQPRPTADGRGKFIRMVSAKAGSLVIPFKESVTWLARLRMSDVQALPAVGPVFLDIECVWKRPQDKKNAAPPDQRLWRMDKQRNDWDNLAKSVCDALNGVFYLDDGQIVGGTVKKFYGRVGEDSHVRVVMRNLLVEGSRNGEREG